MKTGQINHLKRQAEDKVLAIIKELEAKTGCKAQGIAFCYMELSNTDVLIDVAIEIKQR